jgi:hypothetical protein
MFGIRTWAFNLGLVACRHVTLTMLCSAAMFRSPNNIQRRKHNQGLTFQYSKSMGSVPLGFVDLSNVQ